MTNQNSVETMDISTFMRVALVAIVGWQPLPVTIAAEVFRCTGQDGQPVFQQQPCGQASQAIGASGQGSSPSDQHDKAGSTTANGQCEQVANAVRQIGRGYQAGDAEGVLRQRMAGSYSADILQQAFAAFQFGRSVATDDLAVVSQLACESRTDLPAPQAWHLNKNAVTIRLQNWQQIWKWPNSWRVVGIREQPGFQIELAYADFDSAHLRVGCRAHDSATRLQGMGHQLLALWAERVQAGASQPRHSPNNHPSTFGQQETRDTESKRELFTAELPLADNKLADGFHTGRVMPSRVSVALTPQRICVALRSGEASSEVVAREARSMVELLLTNKPSPFK